FFEGIDFAGELSGSSSSSASSNVSSKEINVHDLITAYRTYGHLLADLDPLKIRERSSTLLELASFQLSDSDLDSPFQSGAKIGRAGATLREIIEHLKQAYTGTLTCSIGGCEPEIQKWFQDEFESGRSKTSFSAEEKKK